MKKIIILAFLSILAITTNAQSYQSPAINWSCLTDVLDNNCTIKEHNGILVPTPPEINCAATGCSVGTPPTVKIDYTEITCNGRTVIIGGGYRIDYTSCCSGMPMGISSFDLEKNNSIYWKLLAEKTSTSAATVGTQMFLAKASNCWSNISYTVTDPGCMKTFGEGSGATTRRILKGDHTHLAQIPCTGNGCCMGLATLDPATSTISNMEIISNTGGDCGSPDINRYITAYVSNDHCPGSTFVINSAEPCKSDGDCNFDLSGTYNPHSTLAYKSTGFIMDNKQYQFVNIYPVPVSEYLYISYDKDIIQPIIVDLQGKEVMKVNAVDRKIDVSKLSKGTYIYKAKTSDNKVISKQFIKQ